MTTTSREQALADIRTKAADAERAANAKYDAIEALPAGVPAPDSVFYHRLYGADITFTFGKGHYYSSLDGDRQNVTLDEALALIRSIGTPVDLYSVKDGCHGVKPEAAISETERERAKIEGPFYGIKIVRDGCANQHSATAEAYVTTPRGLVRVRVYLRGVHQLGGFRRVGGYVSPNTGEISGDYHITAQPAVLGQAKEIKYSGGDRRSPGSIVYLFSSAEALDAKPYDLIPIFSSVTE